MDKKKDADKTAMSEAAKALSEKGASQGGKTRAERMTPEERQEASRRAAEARWGASVQVATHEGDLQIGDQRIACAVLEDGTRVINQGTLLATLGRNTRPKTSDAGPVVFAANLRPFISPELEEGLRDTVVYRTHTGARSVGYRAELLPAICEVYLDARAEEKLFYNQQRAARAAEILLRGLARVGIIALVDEATGYQEVRARRELQRILEAYVQAELRPWTKMFPDEFFKEIYRLQGWEYKPGTAKRTPYVGHLVNRYIYEQLPPGVLDKLRTLNPRNAHGNRTRRFHQYLTADTGNPHLDKQIASVTMLMRVSNSKREFEDLFERAFPPIQPRLALVMLDEDEDEDEGHGTASSAS